MTFPGSLARLVPFCLLLLVASCRSPRQLELTEKDSGGTFELRVGDTVTVGLKSNPTTGYGWYPRHGAGDVRILAEKGDLYQADSGASGVALAGQGGTHYFAYRVIGPGICGIALEYKRSWENAAPARTFEIMITATGSPEEAASDPRELPPDEAPVPMTDSKGNVTYRNQL